MDDIEVETTEQYYYDDVSEFVERIELSTEEIILQQICPSKLRQVRSASSAGGHSVEEQGKYVSLRKPHFLNDIKMFLYDYCTTGEFYLDDSARPAAGDEDDDASQAW